MAVKQTYTVAELVEELTSLDQADVWVDGEQYVVSVSGNSLAAEVLSPEVVLWSSECDEREQDDEGFYTESVLEHVLGELERLGRFYLSLVAELRMKDTHRREYLLMDGVGYPKEMLDGCIGWCDPQVIYSRVRKAPDRVFRAWLDEDGVPTADRERATPSHQKPYTLICSWIPMGFTDGPDDSVTLAAERLIEEVEAWRRGKEEMFPENETVVFVRAFSRTLSDSGYRYQAHVCIFTV